MTQSDEERTKKSESLKCPEIENLKILVDELDAAFTRMKESMK